MTTNPKPVEQAKLLALALQLEDGEWWQTVMRGPNPTGFTTDQTEAVRQAATIIRALANQETNDG